MAPSQPGETIIWSAPVDLPGVQTLVAENCARRWREYHETYSVCIGLHAPEPVEWRYRQRTHYQTSNGVMLMEPGEVHANPKITQPCAFKVVWIDPALVRQAAEEFGMSCSQPHLRVAQLIDGPLYRGFLALHECLEKSSTALERQSRFAFCLRLLLQECAERSLPELTATADDAAVARAREYIHSHVTEAIALDELARATGCSSAYQLVRAFTAQRALPPHAYQIQLRIALGRKLLAAGMHPKNVAADLGFADQSHFTRHFRQLGITPAAYAKQTARTLPASAV